MQKNDKSLIEVWEWKEQVYQELKDLTDQEIIEKIGKNANKLLLESKIELKIYKRDYQKIA